MDTLYNNYPNEESSANFLKKDFEELNLHTEWEKQQQKDIEKAKLIIESLKTAD